MTGGGGVDDQENQLYKQCKLQFAPWGDINARVASEGGVRKITPQKYKKYIGDILTVTSLHPCLETHLI